MAKRNALRVHDDIPPKRAPRGVPTIKISVSIPSKTITDIDRIASYLNVTRSYVLTTLLEYPAEITAARIDEFGSDAPKMSEMTMRLILGHDPDYSAPLEDRLQLLKEALDDRDL